MTQCAGITGEPVPHGAVQPQANGKGFAGVVACLTPPASPPRPTSITTVQEQHRIVENFEHPVLGHLRDAVKDRDPNANLYVYGVPQYLDEYGLYLMFSPFGAIASVRVSRRPEDPSQHRGFGFVQFWHPEVAQSAIQHMHGMSIGEGERPLTVRLKGEKAGKDGGKGKGGGSGVAGAPGGGGGDAVTVTLAVPRSHRGLIVGAQAQRLRELQERHQVELKVPRASAAEGDPITVRGPQECVDACVAQIKKYTDGNAEVTSTTGAAGSAPDRE